MDDFMNRSKPVQEIKRILLAIDGSAESRQAIAHVRALGLPDVEIRIVSIRYRSWAPRSKTS